MSCLITLHLLWRQGGQMLLRLTSLLQGSFASRSQVQAFQAGFQAGVWFVPLKGNTFTIWKHFLQEGRRGYKRLHVQRTKTSNSSGFLSCCWGSKVAKQVKAFATKSDSLSSIPGSSIGEGENQLL